MAQNTIPDIETSTNTAGEGDIYIGVPSGNVYIGLSTGLYHPLKVSASTTNLYTSDGSIATSRQITGNPENYLWFNNFKQFYIDVASIYRLTSGDNIHLEADNYIRLSADNGIRLQGNTSVSKDLSLVGRFIDGSFNNGSQGDILSTTGTSTKWLHKSDLLSSNTENSITTVSDGGLYYQSPVKAFGKIQMNGTANKIKGAISKRIGEGTYEITFTTAFNHNNYIIQLSQPSRKGAGYDDPGIAYYDQSKGGFKVEIGDNDNSKKSRIRFDSEFMFVIMDYN
ncbi:MAG: hypothetical protein COB98_08950 [Flavobacteriaceae bacterium]|nr:MAG: hypothetical protein COB98_08950 [Flavobacteriaceae bacterium]